jgi:hypothetical protein
LPKGEKGKRAYISLTKYPFLAIHAKGGESISPKQKDRTTTNFKNIVFHLVLKKFFQFGPKQKDHTTTNFKNIVFHLVLNKFFQLVSYF